MNTSQYRAKENLNSSTVGLGDLGARQNKSDATTLREVQRAAGIEKTSLYEERINILQAENQNLNELVRSYARDRELLKQKEAYIDEVEAKMQQLTGENERLTSELRRTVDEGEELRLRFNELNQAHLNNREDQVRVQRLTNEVERLIVVADESNLEANNWKLRHTELESISMRLKADNDKLKHQVNEYGSQHENLRLKYQGLERILARMSDTEAQKNEYMEEVRRLNDTLRDKVAELDIFRERCFLLEKEVTVIPELLRKVELTTAEVQDLSVLLQERQKECEEKAREISSLRFKVGDLEGKISQLISDNELLVSTLAARDRELASLKGNLTEWQKNGMEHDEARRRIGKQAEEIDRLNGIIHEMSRDRDALYKRVAELEELHNIILTLQEKIRKLIDENERLNNIIIDKDRTIEGLRARCSEFDRCQNELSQLQRRLKLVLTEKDRLARESEERKDEAEQWKARCIDIEKQNEDLGRELDKIRNTITSIKTELDQVVIENRRLEETIQHKNAEIDALQQRLLQIDVLNNKNEDLEKALSMLSLDKNRLEKDYNNMVDEWKRKYAMLEASKAHLLDIEARLRAAEDEIRKMTVMLMDRAKEVDELRTRLVEAQTRLQDIPDLQKRLEAEIIENDRLRENLAAIVKELGDWKRKVYDLELKEKQFNEIQARNTALLRDNETLNETLLIRSREIAAMKKHISELESKFLIIRELEDKITMLLGENDRLKRALDVRHRDNEELRTHLFETERNTGELSAKLKLMKGDIDEDTQIQTALRREIDALRDKLALSERAQLEINDLRTRITMLSGENERLNHMLDNKSLQIEELKRIADDYNLLRSRVPDFERRAATLASEGDRARFQLQDKHVETETLRSRLAEAERNEHEAQEKAILLVTEVERLTRELQLIGQELVDLRGRLRAAEAHSGESTVLNNNLALITAENETLRNQLRDNLRQSSFNNNQRGEYEIRLAQLTNDNERLALHVKDKVRELEELKIRYALLEQEKVGGDSQTKDQLKRMTQELERNTALLNDKAVEAEEWKAKYSMLAGNYQQIDGVRNQFGALDQEYQKAAALLREREREIAALRENIRNLENQLTVVVAENERLNGDLHGREKELQIMQNTLMNSQHNNKNRVNEVDGQVTRLMQENEKLCRLLEEKNMEVENMNTRLARGSVADQSDAKNVLIQNLQSKIILLTAEVDRLSKERMPPSPVEAYQTTPVVLKSMPAPVYTSAYNPITTPITTPMTTPMTTPITTAMSTVPYPTRQLDLSEVAYRPGMTLTPVRNGAPGFIVNHDHVRFSP